MILEKVWAKVYGSYLRIEAGGAGEAMYSMSGCPHRVFVHANVKKIDKFWDRIYQGDLKKYPMVSAVASFAEDDVTHE